LWSRRSRVRIPSLTLREHPANRRNRRSATTGHRPEWQRRWQHDVRRAASRATCRAVVVAAALVAVCCWTVSTARAHEIDRLADRFAVPLPAGDITISFDECPDAPGEGAVCADPDTGRMWLAGEFDLFAFAHELGHVYLERDLADRPPPHDAGSWRGRLSILLGHDPAAVPWDGLDGPHMLTGDDCLEHACPWELAADAYAACALRFSPRGRWVGRGRRRRIVGRGWSTPYDYSPTPQQHGRICRVLRASGDARDVPAFG
jgi:hypothetical protein